MSTLPPPPSTLPHPAPRPRGVNWKCPVGVLLDVRRAPFADPGKIDPVRIESLESFGTPEEVGARVMRVEQGKDGTLDTKLLDTRAEKQGDLSLYTLVRRFFVILFSTFFCAYACVCVFVFDCQDVACWPFFSFSAY